MSMSVIVLCDFSSKRLRKTWSRCV